jgi:threonine dehydrogenase-like Zn-dependent dehydrogenase
MEKSHSINTNVIHDVLIIGAGPAGLAMAARLREVAPSALFTDQESQRFKWIRDHIERTSIKNARTGKVRPAKSLATGDGGPSIHVIDEESGTWMARWKRYFDTFGITQLRSPMLWHVDPQDRDGLLSFSHFHGREKELIELKNCVGWEVSKHARKKRVKAK